MNCVIGGGKAVTLLATNMRKYANKVDKHMKEYNAIVQSLSMSERMIIPGCELLVKNTLNSRLPEVGRLLDADCIHWENSQEREYAMCLMVLQRIDEEIVLIHEDDRAMAHFLVDDHVDLSGQADKMSRIAGAILEGKVSTDPQLHNALDISVGTAAHFRKLAAGTHSQLTRLTKCTTVTWADLHTHLDELDYEYASQFTSDEDLSDVDELTIHPEAPEESDESDE